MTALLLSGAVAALAGWALFMPGVVRGTSRRRRSVAGLAPASALLVTTIGVDVLRAVAGQEHPWSVLALLAVGVVATLGVVWAYVEARAELVLDALIVATCVGMMLFSVMLVATSASPSSSALVDLVGLMVVAWQSYVVVEVESVTRRRLEAPLITGLRVASWGCFVVSSATGAPAASMAALVLMVAFYLGRGVLFVVLARGDRADDAPRSDTPRSPRVPYLLAFVTFVSGSPPIVLRPELQSPITLAIGCSGVLALLLRHILTTARLGRLSAASAARERYFASLLADSTDVIMIADRRGVLSYVSPSATRVLGEGTAVCGGRAWTAAAVAEGAFTSALDRLDDGSGTELLEGRREHVVLEAAMSLRGAEVLVSVRDVTERDRLRQRLHYLAYHDPLTGLANRSRVLSRISAMLSRHELCAVLFVDLDRFKQVNDNSGHVIGDQVLQQVAGRLSGLVRAGDLIGRLGGDEFVAVLSLGRHEAENVATRIGDVLTAPFEVGGRQYQLGVSIGIAEGASGLDAEDLLRRADLAMYQAKRRRGSWVVYEDSLGRAALAQANLDVAVARALRDKDLDVFVQPLVELSTGRVATVEALLRWRDEAGRLTSPAHMLDFARRSGRMDELTAWVLQRSVDLIAASPSHVRIAVNVPPEMLLVPAISRNLTMLLEQHGVPARRVEVEVTEDQLLDQAQESLVTLQRMRDLGMSVMIDDFGTGFSSLGYLLDLPIDGLKVDRRFTKALPQSESARSIVGGLVGIADRLHLRVVAEGVETREQHDWACRLGVHQGQGFWYARPESASSLADLGDLRSWSSSQAAVAG